MSNQTFEEKDIKIRAFIESDTDQVIALWSRCGLLRPWNDARKDIGRKLQIQSDLFLVGEMDGRIISVMMLGYEGHRGWVNYLAVEPECRGRGIGRTMMMEAEHRLKKMGCPKINLQIRKDNLDAIHFYEKLGYLEDHVISMGKRLIKDDEA
jgi:ribosomal protein S18 acetylase RimI-like enzyme